LNDIITSEKINVKNVKMVCRGPICLFRHFHGDRQENHKNQISKYQAVGTKSASTTSRIQRMSDP